MALNYYICDTETSGLSSSYHEITEFSFIRCSDRVQISRNVRCDYPEHANADSLRITGKTLADLSIGISQQQAIEEIIEFLNQDGSIPAGRCIIAHNASFDERFIHALFKRFGKTFPADLWLCSMAMTKAYAKSLGLVKPKVSLAASCELLGVKQQGNAHSAKADSRNTYYLWDKLVQKNAFNVLPFIKNSAQKKVEPEEELDTSFLDED
jgi:DNA polymerase-3 subunit epsilon